MPSLDDLIVPIGGVALLGVAVFSGGGEQACSLLHSGQAVKEARQENAFTSQMLKTRDEGLAKQSEIALSRYQNGCIVHSKRAEVQRPEDVAVGAVTVHYMKVVEGSQPVDYNQQLYSQGSVICDSSGGTGIIGEEGIVGNFAFTGEDISQYVYAHFARYSTR